VHYHRRSADHAPSQCFFLCSPGHKTLQDSWKSVLLGMIGHHRNEATRGEHREVMHSQGGLGDQSCVADTQARAAHGCSIPDQQPFRVFTGAHAKSLRQLDVVPVAFSALLRSFLGRLLFTPSLYCRMACDSAIGCLASDSHSSSRKGELPFVGPSCDCRDNMLA
jgi:hypothetical protein